MSTTIRDILNAKGTDVLTSEASDTVLDAIQKMTDKKVGAVIVMDAGAVCGIFSERDFMNMMVSDPVDPKDTKVKSISTCNVVCVDPTTTVEESMAIMTEVHVRHLPVMDKGQLVGIVSIGDLVKQASKDQETHIHYLTDYVSGKYPG